MASSQQVLPAPFTSSDTRKKRIETYDHFMRKAIGGQTVFDRKKLHEEHKKIIPLVTNGLNNEEHNDVSYLLYARWWNMMEQEEERMLQDKPAETVAHFCVYLTLWTVFVVAHTKQLGNINVTFGNQSRGEPGFSAEIKDNNRKLFWGYDYDKLTTDAQGNKITRMRLWKHIMEAARGNQRSREISLELFRRVKEFVDISTEATMSQVMLVLPTGYGFEQVSFLRECCLKADLIRVGLVSEPSLAAYGAFSKLPQFNDNFVSILVVNNSYAYLRLEIFGCNIIGNKVKAVFLLTATEGKYSDVENVKHAFSRALGQLSILRRNTLRNYVVLDDDGLLGKQLNEYFQNDVKLVKIGNLIDNNNLLDAFSSVTKSPNEVKKLWSIAGGTINSPAAEKSQLGIVKSVKKEDKEVQPARAKIPLEICTSDKKIYKMLAYTDWTVGRLKLEVSECLSKQGKVSLILQHGTQVFNEDNKFLSSFKLNPDAQIQVNFDITKTGGEVSVGGKANTACKLMANCVAIQYGTEHEDVEGIKPGYLVMARTDPDNLTMGEVGATCKINGLGDKIFVGVKLRKHLPLASSNVQIEHATGKDVPCDKCKGRKCLVIPLEFIGTSKEYLFEVQ